MHVKNVWVECCSTSDFCNDHVKNQSTFLVPLAKKEILEDQLEFKNMSEKNDEMTKRNSDKKS